MKKPLVSIIIVNYNGWPLIKDCFLSLGKQTYRKIEVIVVDNNSRPDQVKHLKTLSFKSLNIKFIYLDKNTGFTGGNNAGAAAANGKYIALLNNDTIADENWVVKLVKTLESDPKAGIAVGKIYRVKNELKKEFFDSAGSLYNQIGSAWSRGYLEKEEGQYNKQEEVPMATACSLLFRKEILDKTFLFDDSFFMYMEEFDFCLRVRRLGYSILYTPKAIIYHHFSQSVKKEASDSTMFKQFYANRARMKVIFKYYPWSIIIKNIHLIFASFVYWDYYFLRHGGWKKLWSLKTAQWQFMKAGLKERKQNSAQSNWTKWITYQGFFNLMGWYKTSQKREQSYLNQTLDTKR